MKDRRIFINSTVAILSMLFLVVIFYNFFDQSIAIWLHQQKHGVLYYLSSKFFAPVFSSNIVLIVAFLVLIIGYLKSAYGKPGSARPWLYFSYVYLLAFALRTFFKFVLARYRPELFFSNNLYGFHFFSMKHIYTSMPSGHATNGFVLAAIFSKLIKCKWATVLLFAVGTCVALSRLIISVHYMSDIIFGAYIGCLSAYWINAIYPARLKNT
jgi:membrane-associated phospholipid phosphatase